MLILVSEPYELTRFSNFLVPDFVPETVSEPYELTRFSNNGVTLQGDFMFQNHMNLQGSQTSNWSSPNHDITVIML